MRKFTKTKKHFDTNYTFENMKCLTPTTRSKIVTPNARSKGKIWVAVSNIFERVVGVKILHPRFFFYTNEHQTFEHVDSNYTFEKKFEHLVGVKILHFRTS